MLRSTPPVITASKRPDTSPSTAACSAAMVEAQAASVMKLGPEKLNTLATRPAITLESSPGMVSSVMSCVSARMPLVIPASSDCCSAVGRF